MAELDPNEILAATSEIVGSYLSNASNISPAQIPEIIRSIRATLMEDPNPAPEAPAEPSMTVSKREITKSITPSALISFVDGKPYKTLKRHLAKHGLTIAEYKEKFGLPKDYPSTSPEYSAKRSAMAKSLGLGSRTGRSSAAKAAKAPATRGRGRPKKATV